MVTVMDTDMTSKACAWLAVALSSLAAHAEVTVTPRVIVSETVTDNVRLNDSARQSDQVTDVSPGIQIKVTGGRLKTYLDYSLSQVMYAQGSSANRQLNALTTYGSYEVLDNWAFVDFSGSISQQAISAFGTQSIDNTAINANRAEVSSYRLSPYVKGRFGNDANYEARYSRVLSSNDASSSSGSASAEALIRLSGGSAFRRLGWTADASRQSVSYTAGRPTESDQVNLGLTYELTPQFSLLGSVGQEAHNYTSLDKQNTGTSSLGFAWRPSERTSLSARRSNLSYGNGHQVSFAHRTARTSWTFSDTRDVSSTSGQSSVLQDSASTVPSVVSSFLTSALSWQRSQNLAFSLLGVRSTLTFAATRSDISRLDTLSSAQDDLSTASQIAQRGFSVSLAHRLTPDYTLTAQVAQQTTTGNTSALESETRSLNLSLTGRVGQKTTATVGARRVVSEGGTVPYTENALTGQLNVQF